MQFRGIRSLTDGGCGVPNIRSDLSANAGQHLLGVVGEEQMFGEVQPLLGLLERQRRAGFFAFAVTVAGAAGGPRLRLSTLAGRTLLVRFHVCLQIAGQGERFVAHFADVWFVTCVGRNGKRCGMCLVGGRPRFFFFCYEP